jgi:hypothetical protein
MNLEEFQQSIRDNRQRIVNDLEYHRGEMEVAQARLRTLQRQCKHPDKFEYYAAGERGIRCYDCGYTS